MENKYIYADDLKRKFKYSESDSETDKAWIATIRKAISEMPAADVVPADSMQRSTAMKKVTAIELIFENTESARIDAEAIGSFDIAGIHTEVSRLAINAILETRRCDELILELLPEADVPSDDFFDENCMLFERLKGPGDVTQVALEYEDGSHCIIFVPWNHQNEYQNTYQTNLQKDGHMWIVINTTGSIPKVLLEPQI